MNYWVWGCIHTMAGCSGLLRWSQQTEEFSGIGGLTHDVGVLQYGP